MNNSNSRIGHYCIINCDVEGTIKINEKLYNVQGVGYHEHSWVNDKKIFPSKSSYSAKISKYKLIKIPDWQLYINTWDFSAIFLDNGWRIFSAKFCQGLPYAKIIPGSLWITTDDCKHIAECRYFQLKYLEMVNTSEPGIKIPKKIHIKAVFTNIIFNHPLKGLIILDLYIEVQNLCEFTWHIENKSGGIWEAPSKVYGNIRRFNTQEEIKGFAMLELTRAIYNED
jgi:hypothetical protein